MCLHVQAKFLVPSEAPCLNSFEGDSAASTGNITDAQPAGAMASVAPTKEELKDEAVEVDAAPPLPVAESRIAVGPGNEPAGAEQTDIRASSVKGREVSDASGALPAAVDTATPVEHAKIEDPHSDGAADTAREDTRIPLSSADTLAELETVQGGCCVCILR